MSVLVFLRLFVFESEARAGQAEKQTDGRTGKTRNAACQDGRTITLDVRLANVGFIDCSWVHCVLHAIASFMTSIATCS